MDILELKYVRKTYIYELGLCLGNSRYFIAQFSLFIFFFESQ